MVLGERPQVPRVGGGLVLERGLGELGEAPHTLDAGVHVLGVRELDLEHTGELLGVLGSFVQRNQGFRGSQVLDVKLEHTLEGAHRAVGLAELVAIEHRGAVVEQDLVGVVLELDLTLEGANELVVLVLTGVERLELVPALLLDEQLLDRILRAAVLGVDGEQLAPGVGRARRIFHSIGKQDAELLQHGDLLDRIGEQPGPGSR